MQRGDLYIFSHPDHREELRRKFDEILACFPDESPEPRRMAFEDFRRQQAAEARKKGEAALGRA